MACFTRVVYHNHGVNVAAIHEAPMFVNEDERQHATAWIDSGDGNFSITPRSRYRRPTSDRLSLFFSCTTAGGEVGGKRRRVRVVSISDSNLMASRYPNHDLPIPISRYRPPFDDDDDDDGFRLATARRGSRDLRTVRVTLLAIPMPSERDSTPNLRNTHPARRLNRCDSRFARFLDGSEGLDVAVFRLLELSAWFCASRFRDSGQMTLCKYTREHCFWQSIEGESICVTCLFPCLKISLGSFFLQ